MPSRRSSACAGWPRRTTASSRHATAKNRATSVVSIPISSIGTAQAAAETAVRRHACSFRAEASARIRVGNGSRSSTSSNTALRSTACTTSTSTTRTCGTVELDDDSLGTEPAARSESLGGYRRDYGTSDEYKNNWSYFSDLYLDLSWTRVMLANAETYSEAEIVEPQPLVSWSESAIKLRVNLGALESGEPRGSSS
jgi:hypothetical protein